MRWGVLPGVVRALWLWDGEETEVWEARAEAGRLVVATIPRDSPVCFLRALLLCLLTSVPVGLATCLQLLSGTASLSSQLASCSHPSFAL